jgi:tetratricopeptide (TPR) repeat protein
MKKPQFFTSVAVSILILFLAYNCTAMKKTTTSEFAEDLATVQAEESNLAEASSQNKIPRYGATPEDSIQCIRNLSLYQEYYNQGNRQLAFGPWREVFINCPQASQNTFIRGAILIKMKYSEETDPIRREAWVDTLMMVYDQRIEYFGNVPQSREGLVLGRKAVDLFTLRPNNTLDIYEMTTKSIELEGNASQADVLLLNMQALTRMVEAGLKDPGEILVTYEKLMGIVDHNLANNPADKRFFEPAKTNIDIMFEPYATCENIIALFTPKVEKNPENIELLEKTTSMLNKAGCNDSKLFYTATLSLHRLKPTAQSAFLMGRMENSAENYSKAISFFEQAVSLYEDNSDKFTAYLLMADISYRQLRQFSQARSYALQAAAMDPKNGRPFILIGEMYAASASQCGSTDLTKLVAYWAAVDKFRQALNVDSDQVVQERATQLINTYSQYFPNKELTFFHGLSEGDSYRVECWINETTRVRSRQ